MRQLFYSTDYVFNRYTMIVICTLIKYRNYKYRMDRRQGITELTNTLMNGKEADWDDDDPLPFTAAHLLQLPNLIRNTISPEYASN